MNAVEYHELTPGPLVYLARMTKSELIHYADEKMLPQFVVLRLARKARKEMASAAREIQ